MDETSFTLDDLCDSRLAAHAVGAAPVWLWSLDGGRVLWANPAACAAFGEETLGALASRTFAPDAAVRVQVARLAATLPQNGAPRFQRLRGFVDRGPHLWRPLVCSCTLFRLDRVTGVLAVAIEAAGPSLSLAEQVRRLDLDADTAFAAFAPDGALLFATAEGQRRLGGCATIDAIGADALATTAMAAGDAAGECAIGPMMLRRIGNDASTVLLARFEPNPTARGIATPAPSQSQKAENQEAENHREEENGSRLVAPNVVPFPSPTGFGEAKPGAEHKAPALSAGEHVTFREVARQLTARLQDGEPAPVAAQIRDHTKAPQTVTAAAGYVAATEATEHVAAGMFHDTQPACDDYALLNRLPIGILVYRVDELLLANRAFLTMTGYADLRALSCAGGLDALLTEADTEALADSGETGKRIAIATQSGTQLPVEGRLVAVRWNREPAFALMLSKNETIGHIQAAEMAPHQAETQLREIAALRVSGSVPARQPAKPAMPDKSESLATLCHDARTPLSSILAFCNIILEERLSPIGNERYRKYVDDVRRAGAQLMALLIDAVEPSNIEADTFLTPSTIDLNAVVNECVARIQPEANEGRVIVRTSLSSAALKTSADADAVCKMVSDLLGYVIRGSRPGGQVIVSTGISPGGDVVLRLRDNGYGLSDQTIAAALQPADRQATSPHFSFAGQFLALTKALAEANHARFKITSRPHEGSLFELTFTRRPEIAD